MLYALRGPLVAYVRRFWSREYRDSHEGIKRRDGPLNGLYGGFAFAACSALVDMGAKMPPAGRRTAHKRRESAGEYRDKGGHVGRPGGHKKAHPRLSQGGRWWYSRFFRRLPDNHQGKGKNKQDNQALHLLSSSARRSRSALHSAAYEEPSMMPQARRYRCRSTIHWSRSSIASVVMACAFMAHFLHSPGGRVKPAPR